MNNYNYMSPISTIHIQRESYVKANQYNDFSIILNILKKKFRL